MIQKYLNLGGLKAFYQLLNVELEKKLDKTTLVTQKTDGVMSKEDKIKLDSIEAGAEVNQNAYSFVQVENDTKNIETSEPKDHENLLESFYKKDTLTMVGGRYIKLTGDDYERKLTVDSLHYKVEYDEDGLMTAEDKIKEDRINTANYEITQVIYTDSTVTLYDRWDDVNTGTTTKPAKGTEKTGTHVIRESSITSAGVSSAADKITATNLRTLGRVSLLDDTTFTTTTDKVNLHYTNISTTEKDAGKVTKTPEIPNSSLTQAGIVTAEENRRINTNNYGEVKGDTGEIQKAGDVGALLTISGGTDISTSTSSENKVTVTHKGVSRTNTQNAKDTVVIPGNGESINLPGVIDSISSSETGHITGTETITIPISHGKVTRATEGTETKSTTTLPTTGDTVNLPEVLLSVSSNEQGHVTSSTRAKLPIQHGTGMESNRELGFYKFSTDGGSHVKGVEKVVLADLTGLGAAPIKNPVFEGEPKAPTAPVGTESTQIATTEFVVKEISHVLSNQDALRFKGVIKSESDLPATASDNEAGDTYKIAAAGTYAGNVAEIGDLLLCISDGASRSDKEGWMVVQANIDGAVTGPAGSNDNQVALFDGTSGKIIKTAGTVGGADQPIYLSGGVPKATESTIGSGVCPIWLNEGKLTNSSENVGGGLKPVYLKGGVITASSETKGSSTKPIYLSSGTITESSENVGDNQKPVYLKSGEITAFSGNIGDENQGIYVNAGTLTAITKTTGSTTKPVYFNGGKPTEIGYSIEANVASDAFKQTGHYTPDTSDGTTPESGSQLSFNTSEVITGVTKDNKGHVIKINKAKLPSVDSINASISEKVAKAGDTMTGNLTINPGTSGDVYFSLERGTVSGWKFLNTSGNLKIQNNYTTAQTSWFDVLTLAYNSGNVTSKGNITAPKFIKSGGTSTQVLRADGETVDLLSASGVTDAGWSNDKGKIITVDRLSYWNGAYSGTNSNLTYYKDGAFGSMAKESADSFLKLSGGTMTGKLTTPNLEVTDTLKASKGDGNLVTNLNSDKLDGADLETSGLTDSDTKIPSSKAIRTYISGLGYSTTTGTVTSVATGAGLTGGTITGSGTIKAKLKDETALTFDSAAGSTTSGRVYPVALDKSGYLSVNVPWTDTNTTYGVVSSSANGLSPKVINTNTVTVGSGYYVLASQDGSTAPSWYKLPGTSFSSGITYSGGDGITISGSTISADKKKSNDRGDISVYGAGYVTEIPSESDLDSYTTPGTYYIASGTILATLKNIPTDLPANANSRLTVIHNTGTAGGSSWWGMQILTVHSSEVYLYFRTHLDASWGSWKNMDISKKLGTSTIGSTYLPIYLNSGSPTACSASSLFSAFSASGNNISMTVAGQTRTLTAPYATNSGTVGGYSAVGLTGNTLYKCCLVGSNTASLSSYWVKAGSFTTGTYIDDVMTLLISDGYGVDGGILRIRVRENDTVSSKTVNAYLMCGNLSPDILRIYYDTTSHDLELWINTQSQYKFYIITVLSEHTRTAKKNDVITLYDTTFTAAQTLPSTTYVTPTNLVTDTKNTAGSTDTSSKIYLIGATSQAANPQTYSHDTAYVGTDGCLYSGGTKVLTEIPEATLDTLGGIRVGRQFAMKQDYQNGVYTEGHVLHLDRARLYYLNNGGFYDSWKRVLSCERFDNNYSIISLSVCYDTSLDFSTTSGLISIMGYDFTNDYTRSRLIATLISGNLDLDNIRFVHNGNKWDLYYYFKDTHVQLVAGVISENVEGYVGSIITFPGNTSSEEVSNLPTDGVNQVTPIKINDDSGTSKVESVSISGSGGISVTPSGSQSGAVSFQVGISSGYTLPTTTTLNSKVNKSGDTMTGNLTAPRFISTQETGMAPFEVASSTVVTNLNADKLDGRDASEFAVKSNTPDGGLVVKSNSSGQSSFTNEASVNGETMIYVGKYSASIIGAGIKIMGSGATSVSSDADGVITINSTDTNTTYSAQSISSTTAGLISYSNNRYLTQQASVGTATSVTSLSPQYGTYIVTTSSSGTLGFSSYSYAPTNWKMDIIIKNSGSSDITITIPSSSSYVNCDKTTSIKISSGKVGEVNVIYANSTYYTRTAV